MEVIDVIKYENADIRPKKAPFEPLERAFVSTDITLEESLNKINKKVKKLSDPFLNIFNDPRRERINSVPNALDPDNNILYGDAKPELKISYKNIALAFIAVMRYMIPFVEVIYPNRGKVASCEANIPEPDKIIPYGDAKPELNMSYKNIPLALTAVARKIILFAALISPALLTAAKLLARSII